MSRTSNRSALRAPVLRAWPASLVLALALVVSAAPLQAGTLYLGVDSAQSAFTAQLQLAAYIPFVAPLTLNSPGIGGNFSGAAPTNATIPPATSGFLGLVDITGGSPGTPGKLTDNGGGFDFTNFSYTFNGPVLPVLGAGSASVSLVTPHVDIQSGKIYLPTSAGVGTGTYDVSGLGLTFSGGTLSYSSTGYLNFIGGNSINFLSNFTKVNLPAGTKATLTLGAGPPNNQLATLSIPLALTIPIVSVGDTILGAGINALVTGNVVFTGVSVAIPEPGSVVLMALGCVALVPLFRNRRRATRRS